MTNTKNTFAAILAGGSGTRMGNPERPKQFYTLGSKPVLIHTLEAFCVTAEFDKVLILCPSTWVEQTRDLIAEHCPQYSDQTVVVPGGATRNDTIQNALTYIYDNYEVDSETIIVTHDAVRPFVSYRIIMDNIASARTHGACDTVIPATDTIVESLNAETISDIPNRQYLYQGQTPQSFRVQELLETMLTLTPEEKAVLTDACKIYVLRGKPVALVQGDSTNIKITFPQDMRIAQALLEN